MYVEGGWDGGCGMLWCVKPLHHLGVCKNSAGIVHFDTAEGLYRSYHWGFSPHLLTPSYNILLNLQIVDWYHQESFTSPRAMMSLRLFNGFRLLATKSSDAEDLKTYVETLAFRSDSTGVDASFQDWIERERERNTKRKRKREKEWICELVGLCCIVKLSQEGSTKQGTSDSGLFLEGSVQYCWGRIDTLQAYGERCDIPSSRSSYRSLSWNFGAERGRVTPWLCGCMASTTGLRRFKLQAELTRRKIKVQATIFRNWNEKLSGFHAEGILKRRFWAVLLQTTGRWVFWAPEVLIRREMWRYVLNMSQYVSIVLGAFSLLCFSPRFPQHQVRQAFGAGLSMTTMVSG